MKNMKMLSASLLVATLVFIGSAQITSASSHSRNPLTMIWQAIYALQYQLAHLPTGVVGPKGDTGDQGLPGIQGPQGEPGTPGAIGGFPARYIRTIDVVIPPQSTFGGITGGYATCDAGDALLSGGSRLALDDAKIMASYPFGTGDWFASASNQNNIFNTLTVFALCADINL